MSPINGPLWCMLLTLHMFVLVLQWVRLRCVCYGVHGRVDPPGRQALLLVG